MGSVTDWLTALRDGDRDAAQLLWNRYYAQLVRVARAHLRAVAVPLSDEEDVTLQAFEVFFRAIEANRYPDIRDRQNLWNLLLYITACKSASALRFETTRRRDCARIADLRIGLTELREIASNELSPETAYATAESLRELLEELGDSKLKQIAILRMEGHTPQEIAATLSCSESTIQRKLRRIRQTWSHRVGL